MLKSLGFYNDIILLRSKEKYRMLIITHVHDDFYVKSISNHQCQWGLVFIEIGKCLKTDVTLFDL